MFFHIKMLDELVEEFLKEVDQNNSSSSIASDTKPFWYVLVLKRRKMWSMSEVLDMYNGNMVLNVVAMKLKKKKKVAESATDIKIKKRTTI